MNSPVRLGVSRTTSTPTGFFSQRCWGFISLCWNPGLLGLPRSPAVPPGLSICKCRTMCSTSGHLTQSASCNLVHPVLQLQPCCVSSPPLLPVWMSVPSLSPWLLDFHTVWFSGSSDWFLFLKLLLSFFWLREEAMCIYLHLHLGQKSLVPDGFLYFSEQTLPVAWGNSQ